MTPDILTMAKAITNGCIPMGAVAVGQGVYDTILAAAPEEAIEFFHGYTWSAHPVACAASLAALAIYRKEDLFAKARGFRRTSWRSCLRWRGFQELRISGGTGCWRRSMLIQR